MPSTHDTIRRQAPCDVDQSLAAASSDSQDEQNWCNVVAVRCLLSLIFPPQSSTKRSMFSKLGAKKYTASKGRAWQGAIWQIPPCSAPKRLWCRGRDSDMHMLQASICRTEHSYVREDLQTFTPVTTASLVTSLSVPIDALLLPLQALLRITH